MRKIMILLLTAVMLVSVSACTAESAEIPVETTPVQKQSVDAFGVVNATVVKNITLDFQAPITGIHVKEGEHVARGKKLVSLDMTEMESAVAVKELSLAAAKKDTDRIQENTNMNKLLNDRKNAQSIYEKSIEELEAQENLFETGSVSLNELEGFSKQADSANKNVQDISYAIESLKNDRGSQNDRINLEVSTLEMDLNLLNSRLTKAYLSDSCVVSDVSNGIVYDIAYIEGDIAGPQKKLLSIMSLDDLEIHAYISEEFYKDIKIGSAVTISPASDKTKQYTGHISHISSRALVNNGETQIPVRIAIDKADDFLLPGFNVDVSISIEAENSTAN